MGVRYGMCAAALSLGINPHPHLRIATCAAGVRQQLDVATNSEAWASAGRRAEGKKPACLLARATNGHATEGSGLQALGQSAALSKLSPTLAERDAAPDSLNLVNRAA